MRILLMIFFMLILPTNMFGQNSEDRRDYYSGTGNSSGGNVTTYTDPQTGDIVTSVVPPKDYQDQVNGAYNQQNMPLFIYPQIDINGGNRPKPEPRP